MAGRRNCRASRAGTPSSGRPPIWWNGSRMERWSAGGCASDLAAALPVTTEIDRGTGAGDQHEDRADLQAVAVAPVILLPGSLPRVTNKVDAGDAMVMAHLAPAQPREIRFRLVGAGLVGGVLDPSG